MPAMCIVWEFQRCFRRGSDMIDADKHAPMPTAWSIRKICERQWERQLMHTPDSGKYIKWYFLVAYATSMATTIRKEHTSVFAGAYEFFAIFAPSRSIFHKSCVQLSSSCCYLYSKKDSASYVGLPAIFWLRNIALRYSVIVSVFF